MPPRKSDSARKSDVSMAKFVLAEDESTQSPTPAPAPAAAQMPVPIAPAPAPSATPAPTPAAAGAEKREGKESKERDAVAIEDLNLPKSIITRLAKGVLPPNTQIQANAILAISKSATVFINHLANAANENTQSANKKTIMPTDVFRALDDIEFGFMEDRLAREFEKFTEIQTSKRTSYRKKVAAAKAGRASGDADTSILSAPADDEATEADDSHISRDSAPRPKKQKVASSKAKGTSGGGDGAMEVDDEDGDATEEFHDAPDAETEPEEEADEDEAEDGAEEEEEEEGDDEEEENMQDALEEKEAEEDDDEALSNGEEE